MNIEIPAHTELKKGSPKSGDRLEVLPDQQYGTHTIVIAATFTADPLRQPLKFWMETLDISAETVMAPYAQVMQELLSAKSLLSQNKRGFNILLIRLEDWIRDRLEVSAEQNLEHLRAVARDFVTAMNVIRARTSTPILVFLCPPSSTLAEIYRQPLEGIQRDLANQLIPLAHVYCWAHCDLIRLYPVNDYEDLRAERIGHIPYTHEYFIAIATLLARHIAALSKPQYKVIAIDCDNTLWRGVCGEDGATGVEITPAHLEFQKMLVRQHDAGMLLCLCSKNNPSDVEAVFRNRPDMLLREAHLISSRVNWNPKSSNLQAIAQELDLSLDSFIFVDDSLLECAEVQANCPSVLTLQFPEGPELIQHFLDHVWAFDRIGVTEEAKQRTAQYRQNRERNAVLKKSASLEQFIASLELKVDVSPMQSEQLVRVAELVQRTTQFNLTGVRRRSTEIEQLCKSGDLGSLVVHVRDRFGDYGLVGALLYRRELSSIDVDTFVLSCRVLGRGVEHKIANELGRIAREDGLPNVVLKYRKTPRNAPAWIFLEKSFSQFQALPRSNGDSVPEIVFTIPVEHVETLGNGATAQEAADDNVEPIAPLSTGQLISSTQWHNAAYRLSRVSDIAQEISRSVSRGRRSRHAYVAPQTRTENVVAEIWADLLGMKEVGVRDDFFDLGGDSLIAVQVISRIGSVLGLELSLQELFDGPTVGAVATRLASASQSGSPIERITRARPVSLSWAQQRLWFIDQLENGSAAYHVPVSVRLHGELNYAALQAALDTLVERHESLRTVFVNMDGGPVQKISPEARFALRLTDLRAQAPKDREAEVLSCSRQELATLFDLSTGPLIRGVLLQLSEDDHVLLITMHHIVSDGWSIGVLLRELGAIYEAHCEGKPTTLPPLSIQYADYAQWQRQWLEGTQLHEQLRYWKWHLQGVPELLSLPTDRPRPAVQSYHGASARVSLGSDLAEDLKVFSRRLNMTLAMTLYTAWSILLSRLSGQDDIVVGMPVANRRRTELEGLIGFFVNTLAVRVRLREDSRVTDLLQRVKEIMLGAYTHQDVPFEQVVEALQPARSLSYSPIFQVLFVLQNAPRGVLQLPGLTLVEQEVPLHTAQFDLSLSLQETIDGISGTLTYASDLFDGATIERWVGYFETTLRGMIREPQLEVSALPLMPESERREVVESFNATRIPYPQERLIHQLFEEQARSTPDAVAVLHEGQSLTYGELNGKANRLARHLRSEGVGPDQLVGICVGRSLEMVVGVLAVLKAGGAYVPLDPNYPAERLQYMLEDAAPQVVLTQEELKAVLPVTQADVILLDAKLKEVEGYIGENLSSAEPRLTAQNLVYVIYTSGSTGRPKGTAMSHGSMVNLIEWHRKHLPLREGQRVLQFAALSFDVAFQEVFSTLCAGGTLVLLDEWVRRDARALVELLSSQSIERLFVPPLMLQSLAECSKTTSAVLTHLKDVITAGEQLRISPEIAHFVEQLSGGRLHNHYGPTETHVVTSLTLTGSPGEWPALPAIGEPISNTQIYILDRRLQPVPIGVAGEIYIGGVGVARAYLNRAELTAERFVRNPFGIEPHARMYKTGDLGRWRVDGRLEYLGRNDDQVKIRGYRIELGEVEAQLARNERVKEAAVIAREDTPGEKRLVAYVRLADQSGPSVEELRAYLKAALPEYMVPNAFVILESLPLTPSGKLNRRALPAPELGAYTSQQYEAPQGRIEEVVAGIWRELLRVERVGRQDNFFELGGHSLLIVQLMERLRRAGLPIRVRRVFESPTLADLASAIASEDVEQFVVPPNLIPPECEAITPQMLPLVELEAEHIERIVQSVPGGAANIQDIYPLVALQEGILFHHLLNAQGSDTYLRPTLWSFSSRDKLEGFIRALQDVIDRHDILRTAVLWEQLPRPVQVIHRKATLPVEDMALDRGRDPIDQLKERMRFDPQKLDLGQTPLMRLRVAADPRGSHWYALLQTHHLACDNESLEVMFSEVATCLAGRAHELPQPAPYRNHVAQALDHACTHDAEAFFRSKLGDVDEPTAPFGVLDVDEEGSRLEIACLGMEPMLADRIRLQARRLSVSAATLFHAAWSLVVAHTSGRDDVVFGTVLLGRLQGSAGAQRTLGMFINTLPLRLQLKKVTAKGLVEQTHREVVELLNHEQASLAAAQRCSAVGGSAPLFSSLLNYLHTSVDFETAFVGTGVRLLASWGGTNYPIVLLVRDQGKEFVLELKAADPRIDPHRMTEYMQTAMRSLIEALEQASQTPALALSVLPTSDFQQVTEQFNAPLIAYPKEKMIHELFEEQAERIPDTAAVVYATQSLTYADLNSKANQLARYLRGLGVGPDTRVALCLERGLEMVVGLLAILKAGGAYVPLDPVYPGERLKHMLQDAEPVAVLTQSQLLEGLELPLGCAPVVLNMTVWGQSVWGHVSTSNLNPDDIGLRASHLAYVIYTSGSTGKPKGVMVEHANVVHFVFGLEECIHGLQPDCRRIAWNSSFGFDMAVKAWGQLIMGRTVYLIPESTRLNGEALLTFLEQHHIDAMECTPSHLRMMEQAGFLQGRAQSLRKLFLGGEAIDAETWKVLAASEGTAFFNMYGPTECTVDASCGRIRGETPHIGHVMPNARIYILSAHRQPAPIGVAGEIFIGGSGVARGYLNRPELTAERFLLDSFSTDPQARMYKTGDLGRWRDDGTIEYLGRNDHQVKIRGFRIELGEIAAQLLRCSPVKDAVVIAREDVPGEKCLVAYVTSLDQSGPSIEVLREHLKAVLPEHMVPSAFVVLESLPVTPNGKLDRRALPAPELGAYASRRYEAPQGDVEETLARIWQELLRVERVGRQDNFFELGGHSLLIMQTRERLRRVGLSAEVRRMFESPTLADLASALTTAAGGQFEVPLNSIPENCEAITPQMLPLVELEAEHIERIAQSVPGGAANIQDIYPLAPLQEGILFHHLLNERGGDTYVVPIVLSVSSRQRLEELITALQIVIDRHDVLRTAVLWEQLPRPVQVVYRRATLPIQEIVLNQHRDSMEQIREWIKADRQRLDLRLAPLMKLQFAPDPTSEQWYALLQFHHIIGDNTSQEIVISEVVSQMEGRTQQLWESVPYRNHVAQTLVHGRMHDAETFFRSKLGDVVEPTAPFGMLDVHGDGSQIEEAHDHFELAMAQRVRRQARRLGVSTATLFHAAWGLVVAHTSGRDDVVFGSVLLGRLQGNAGAQRILGMFINTLPLRLQLRGMTAKELVEHTQRELAQLLGHEQASLAVAQRCSGIVGSAPLFTALLNYRHSISDSAAQWSSARGVQVLLKRSGTNYPITLSVDDLGGGFALTAQTDRYIDPHRITGYLRVAMEGLVEALEQTSPTPVLSLSILSESERHQIIDLFNTTQAAYPKEKLVHQLFEEQVESTPDAIAAVYEGESLTYAELNGRANQLGRYLKSLGVAVGDYLPILMPRSLQMLVAQIAVLKNGGAYVPMDPELPAERRAFMIRDCGALRILADGKRPKDLSAVPVQWIDCADAAHQVASESGVNLGLQIHPAPPAYVMYTSGSTGAPKGVVVPHHGVNRLVINNEFLPIELSDCIAHYSNPAFDASTLEIWGALLNGARVLIVSPAIVLEAQRFAELLKKQRVTVLYMSVGLFNRYTEALADVFSQLRYLMVGGDSLEPGAIRRVLDNSPPRNFLNVYGPTECTTISTSYHIRDLKEGATSIPIGRPISNTTIYILDSNGQAVPIGVPGEIYIGGPGVARGYLNRPDLTAERFLHDPFSAASEARMYKSGDLGRWRSDGAIEYLGRNDDQVKIRGFRIELGEIEVQLARYEHVNDAAVIAREDISGEKRLVAYVTDRNPGGLRVEELRAYLKGVLPEYMVPSAFVTLESLPLTPSGKLDRRALPAPELGAYVSRQYERPQGDVEEILAGIWQGLLGVERVGRQDNFFELGGHSLLIVQMKERLRRVGLSVEVRRVFESPTLADLASALMGEASGQNEVPPNLIPSHCEVITPQMLPLVELQPEHIERILQSVPGGAANVQDIYPLAPLQEGILFHHLLDKDGGDTYVLPTILSVSSRERLDDLIAALQGVIDRHDILRTAVLWEQLPRPIQVVYRHVKLVVEEIALSPDRDPVEEVKEWMEPERQKLDLRWAPLMRVKVAADPQGDKWFVLLQLHHIVADGVSMRIVISEVVAQLEGRAQSLPESVPYRNHVAQALENSAADDAEAFFRSKLREIDEPTAPFGLVDVHGDGTQIDESHIEVEFQLAQRVRFQARRLGVSTATLFHASWGLIVAHTSGRDDVVFGSVLLGRLQGSAGGQRILGMFINTLPLRLQLRGLTAKQLVEHTQRELVELLSHEQASLAVAQRCSGIVGSAPLFSALLNYRHSLPTAESNWARAPGVQVLMSQNRTNYPITLSVDDRGEGFELTAQTDRRIDPHRITSYLNTAIESLVESLEHAPHTPALALSILPETERRQVIESFNATRAPYPKEKLIHQLFEEQARQTPDAVAVLHEGQSLTYGELNGKANQLARHLRSQGVCPDQLVGICVGRSLEMVVGVLAVLKAGGAYVPLDPNYPPERLQYMLEDAAPQVVLTQGELKAVLPVTQAHAILLDATLKEVEGHNGANLTTVELELTAQNLVYVIYTSGSTGRPKGTAMSHGSMVNLIEWHRKHLPLREGERVLQFAALSFDVAFQDTFSTLCMGGTLVLLDERVRRDARALLEMLNSQSIERLFVPPLMLQSVAECFNSKSGRLKNLRNVITAGEQLRISPEIVSLFEQLGGCRLHNHYGPTETHVVTALTLYGNPVEWPIFPTIGQPISNAQMYVLGGQRQPVPIGVAGEIYIGGAGVARGYLKRPDLTAERFLSDPFSADPQARMYKTGDLGRWRADGTLEYLGRNDDQVKIRGFRIELGEIEAQLARNEHVKEAAVVAREDTPGEKRLVGYVTFADQSGPSVEELRAYLKAALPEYMVPSAFVILDSLPLTPSGKLNRRALPAPEFGAYASQEYEAPQGRIEDVVAGIWRELLRVERVGRRDNFFELGGHSLHAMKLIVKIEERFNVILSVIAVFQYPTIQEIANFIESMLLEPFDGEDIEYEEGIILTHVADERVTSPAAAMERR